MNNPGQLKSRLCLPVEQWPVADQIEWAKVCTATSFMDDDEDGKLARLASATRKKYAMGYGRWIKFLMSHAAECLHLPPSKRCIKENIRCYMDVMRSVGNSDGTMSSRLVELAAVVSAFDPNFDRRFLNGLVSVLKAKATPVRSKAHIKNAEELVNLAFRLMAEASDPTKVKHAKCFRDGLIIGFLALHPVRRRNLVSFHLDKNLTKQGNGYQVVFGRSETKTGVPYEMPLADVLIEPMNQYLTVWRPVLMKKVTKKSRDVGSNVWVTSLGSPMSPNAVSGCIELRTRKAFGKSINPHGFRDAAATSMAVNDPKHVRVAAPLLGHRSLETTEKHYIQAKGLDAQRCYLLEIERLKKGNSHG
jgi:integrase/recombinase XerD